MTARRTARTLLVLCSLAAVAATLSAVPVVLAASSAVQLVEVWRMVGFATFAALFALLAARPRVSTGLWLVLIANKAVLSLSAATWLSTAAGAGQALVWDGALTVFLATSFVLVAPWRPEPSPLRQHALEVAPA